MHKHVPAHAQRLLRALGEYAEGARDEAAAGGDPDPAGAVGQRIDAPAAVARCESCVVRRRHHVGGKDDTVRAASGQSVLSYQDLWPRFVGAAIALLVLDLLVRRVRLFDRKFVPKASAA